MENRDDQNKNQSGQQGQAADKSAFGQPVSDASLAPNKTDQINKDEQPPTEAKSDKGFVGSSKEDDTSEAYLSEKETGKSDFAAQGQGASEQNEDIESGTSATRDASLDDGS